MERMVLTIYQIQIVEQCEYVFEAYSGTASPYPGRVWFSLQALLAAAANISKLLWGWTPSQAQDRASLRVSLSVSEDSPLRNRKMRDNFEHLDERIDRWTRTTTQGNFEDGTIGPPGLLEGIVPKDSFRTYDPATGEVRFWGTAVNILELVAESRRIHPLAVRAAMKSRAGASFDLPEGP